ncbi:MAG: hypothetical protein GY894_08915 [Planctomycetes bacterium]|nr:hypothetical protein [Planctomycetota bacterium]MCP4839463.1 hypothetical protein [Planctomycetota bacterium]
MIRVVGAFVAALVLIGCGSVTRIHGWAGGPVEVGTRGSAAVVRYQAPRPGWTMKVDRGRIDGQTAILWMTATGQADGPLDRTTIEASWTGPEGESFECVQVNLRVLAGDDANRQYLAAATGCGPLDGESN